jgi:hypothetical protein
MADHRLLLFPRRSLRDRRTALPARYRPAPGDTRDIARAHGRGTLSYDGTDTEVTFTEVTDRDVKHRVVIAYAALKPRVILATGEHKNRPVTSFLVAMGLARDDTPEGLLPAVPHVTVFEVSPAA